MSAIGERAGTACRVAEPDPFRGTPQPRRAPGSPRPGPGPVPVPQRRHRAANAQVPWGDPRR
eukprot:445-Eustigmatos_ZCMA.PRE.1